MIRKRLFELQDLKYKQVHSNLCPNNDNIIGVRVPVLKKIAKDLYNQDKDILRKIGNLYYEEVMLQGLIISLSTKSVEERIKLVENFVPKIDNWAICDTFCSSLKINKKEKSIYWDFLKKYYKSNKEFEIRFLLVMLLDHYLEENYIDEICNIIRNIHNDCYYVKMAKAWLISIMYIKYPQYTLEQLDKLNLDSWTYNKSIQKIIESKRVGIEQKKYLIQKKKISRD